MMGMTNEQVLVFNQGVIDEFRANKGVCGGHFEGNPMVLLTVTGRKSGRSLTSPLSFYRDGDQPDGDVIVMASAAGAPTHPSWYLNLAANPDVTVEVGTETYEATAVVTSGPERARVGEAMIAAMPRFGEYQEKTDREIPIIALKRK